MPAKPAKYLLIYRMTHVDNIPFIVKNGLWPKLSPVQDPCFVPIGNPDIIDRRTNKPIGIIPPGGVLGEFIPFYFSGHSPMLYNIATGYNVKLIPQKDIVFMECDALDIINAGIPFCFTDGNAAQNVTRFYNNLTFLRELDWATIRATLWANTADDFDRVRKKMSEFLVKGHIPTRFIKRIIVKNEIVAQKIVGVPVAVDSNFDFYYRRYD